MESADLDLDHNRVRDLRLVVGLDQYDKVVLKSVHQHHAAIPKNRTENYRDALRQRCLTAWNISAKELDSLRPTTGLGGAPYYRHLLRLAEAPPAKNWDYARRLLLAARDTRVRTIKSGVKHDSSVARGDIQQALASLAALDRYAPPPPLLALPPNQHAMFTEPIPLLPILLAPILHLPILLVPILLDKKTPTTQTLETKTIKTKTLKTKTRPTASPNAPCPPPRTTTLRTTILPLPPPETTRPNRTRRNPWRTTTTSCSLHPLCCTTSPPTTPHCCTTNPPTTAHTPWSWKKTRHPTGSTPRPHSTRWRHPMTQASSSSNSHFGELQRQVTSPLSARAKVSIFPEAELTPFLTAAR